MSTIAVIGAGHIGRSFSLAAIRSGHDVVLANGHDPATMAELVGELGPRARAAATDEAALAGDFAVVAIPLGGLEAVPVEPFADKIVLTTINYFPGRAGAYAELDSGRTTVPGLVQAHLAASFVARAFNHIDAAQILSDGTPAGTPDRRALAYAADDQRAGETARELYEQFGFDAISVGGLDAAWRLDVNQPAFVTRMNRQQLEDNLARAVPVTGGGASSRT